MRRINILILTTFLISVGCRKTNESEKIAKWSYIESLSVKDINKGHPFRTCAVDSNEMLMLSLDKYIRFDAYNKIIDSRVIDTKNFMPEYKGGFLSKDFYVLSNYLKISTEHLVDSLQFDFYSTKSGNISPKSIHTKDFPNSNIYGYQIPIYNLGFYYENCAVNANNQLGIILTSYYRNQPNNSLGYHHLAIFDLNITQSGINPKFNKLIDLLDFPWNSHFFSLKAIGSNFYLTTCKNGSYMITPAGEIHHNENIGALFSYNDSIFQFSHKKVYYSSNGIDWNFYKSVEEAYVVELSVVDKYAVDYSYGLNTYYTLPDFNHKITNCEGTPKDDCYFIKEFNDKIYLSNWNGGVYSIKKSDLFK